ncbi:Hypothetical protein ORPV_864 [Orpheovirus IHUMI-LCC2]|uniref:Uncharacterized protein n=1 Tax=Orpheovirus IHUMI-LCC2 TaxID=2023057 RepID=A0A2I2L5E6_9VIRU|nr:Hypothetical protein ORPV_864 [Orpheovirus IHUMI-LCC2]SNW62768.1 Hypothetical protein ORPV_864 [Orpheovirus IHUMI-LCC2]
MDRDIIHNIIHSYIYNKNVNMEERVKSYDTLINNYDDQYAFEVMLYIIRKSQSDLFPEQFRQFIVNKYLDSLMNPSRDKHLVSMITNWDNRHLESDTLSQTILSKYNK